MFHSNLLPVFRAHSAARAVQLCSVGTRVPELHSSSVGHLSEVSVVQHCLALTYSTLLL